MTSTVVLSGFAALRVNAVTWSDANATPRFCSVGDTITITVDGGIDINEYRYGYKYGDQSAPNIYITDWVSYSTCYFVPETAGNYYFVIYARDGNGSTNSSFLPVTVSQNESSDESSDESSFDSMGGMPSNWQGDDYIKPSAGSTPDLSYNGLPDLEAFEVSEDFNGIINRAFNAFPHKLIVLMIPTIICLFIGWWLHK